MERKIAFFDIDGTMLDVPNKMFAPSEETVKAIKKFQSSGNPVFIATARSTLPECIEDIGFDGYICSDGHYIKYNEEILVNNCFSTEQIIYQMDLFKEKGGEYFFSGQEGMWVSDTESQLFKTLFYAFNNPDDCENKPRMNWTPEEVTANSSSGIFSTAEALIDARENLPSDWEISSYETGIIRMDIHLPGFTKGTACKHMVEELKINPKNAYAFGDGINDIEMLTLIENSFAMGNASDEIKKVARYVTDSVTEEGIGKAFKKHLGI